MLLRSSWVISASTLLSFSFFNFIIIFLTFIYFFNIYTSSTFLHPLPFHPSTTFPTFFPPLPFHLPTTLYINIILPFSLRLLLFLSLLIHTIFYKFVTTSFVLCIVFPHKKDSLSLSLSLSLNFLVDFLFFLHLCFRLIVFYILQNSILV